MIGSGIGLVMAGPLQLLLLTHVFRALVWLPLIPTLCKLAGVPESDALGSITGHRARSTIATMLRKNGVSLEDLSQFLGHANPEMVKAYARTDPFRFRREMVKANDLMRLVEGIIDTRAAKAGKPKKRTEEWRRCGVGSACMCCY